MSRTAALPAPRRVLMTVDAVGGVWRYAVDLCRSLGKWDVECVLLGLGPPPSADQEAEAKMCANVRYRASSLPLDWMVADESEIDHVPEAILEIAREERVELLHLNLPTQVAERSPLPAVAVSHSCFATWWRAVHPQEPFPAEWDWHRRRTAAGLQQADAAIVPSGAHASALRREYGDPSVLHVVPNGSAIALEGSAKEPFILSLGRWWDAAKNARTLDLAARNSPWPVRIGGPLSGPDGSRYTPQHLVPLGNLTRTESQAVLARAGIFVSPALYEPFGLAVLEAARAGAALVLSDIPTFRELWDGAAYFADPRSPKSFARILEELTQDAERREIAGRAARQRAETYSLQRQADNMRNVYAQAMARRLVLAGG